MSLYTPLRFKTILILNSYVFSSVSQKLTEEEFWSQPSKFTPESRVQAHRFMEEKRKEKEESSKSNFPDLNPAKRVIRFFNEDGRPLNINQDKIDFTFTENDDFTAYVLDVACYKHLGISSESFKENTKYSESL